MKEVKTRKKYEPRLKDRAFLTAIIISSLMFIASLYINYIAGVYATEKASSPVTDLILDHLKARNVDKIFSYGTILFAFFLAAVLALNPKKIPFTLKSIALFVLLRSAFVSFTHIGPSSSQLILPEDTIINKFVFNGDLFFSGHTGLPFLLALLFWNNRRLCLIFLLSSFTFAVIVLIGHYHYSIDVFAAFFITYAIAELAKLFFKRDYEVFADDSPSDAAST